MTNSFIPPFSSSHTHSAALLRPQSPRNALYRPHHPPTRWHLHRVTTVTGNLQLPACSHIVWKCSNSYVSCIWTCADVHTHTYTNMSAWIQSHLSSSPEHYVSMATSWAQTNSVQLRHSSFIYPDMSLTHL